MAPNDWTPRSEAYFVFPLAQGTPGKQCGLAATGDYQPSLRSPWLAAGESAVLAQIIVVVQIFVAQRQTIYPLGHQIPHAVFDALGVAVIGEASDQAIQQADTLIHLAQQQSATVRSDSPTVKAANHLAPTQGLIFQLFWFTLAASHGERSEGW